MSGADFERYRSVSQPENFFPDWRSFYAEAAAAGASLRKAARFEIIPYGQSPAQLFNLFLPRTVDPAKAVFVFIHGGAFTEGHPDLYDFVGAPYLDAGHPFVSVGYRLDPEARFPDSATDVARALAVLLPKLHQSGIPVPKLCLCGHSAGASIAALVGVKPDLLSDAGVPREAIDSLVLLSGIYDFRPPDPAQAFVDPPRRIEASPILNLKTAPRATVVAYGVPELNRRQNDPMVFRARGRAFVDALRAANYHALEVALPDTDHVGIAKGLMRGPIHDATMAVLAG